jgi:hypothetical protein
LLRHLFLDQVMPLLLSMAGEHVLHASAAEYGGRAVAFVGESGAGKSTLAAALGREAGRIVADDCVMFSERAGDIFISAPYPSLRLWRDSADALDLGRGLAGHRDGKRRFQAGPHASFAAGPTQLDAICLLDRSDSSQGPTITRVPSPEAVVMLVRHAFKFDGSTRTFLEREFRFLTRLVRAVPCYRLKIRGGLEELSSLHTLVTETVQLTHGRRIA